MSYNKSHLLLKLHIILFAVCIFSFFAGCRHDHMPSLSTGGHDYIQVNLVADTIGFDAARVDSNLKNPWGISIGKTGSFWISGNHTGTTVVYDSNGLQLLAAVAIPFKNIRKGGTPTGAVYNPTASFIVNGKTAKFIYCTENGTIDIWNSGDSTITVVNRSAQGAIYKGITLANDGTGDFIYAADFFNGKIDVFDQTFNYLTSKPFADLTIPNGFAPFNIRNIGGKLYVTYAKQKTPDKHEDETGLGNGYINVFHPDGSFVKRFASQGALNSPWGIMQAPEAFGQGTNYILVANFGDGRINVYDTSGNLKGPLENVGIPIVINGLWDIAFHPSSNTQLYFTAGPGDEQHGLFGYLKLK